MVNRVRSVLSAVAAVVLPLGLLASGIPEVSDIRATPLLNSSWGQKSSTGYNNTGVPCFNYFTPNQYPCGCCATALAQVLRYWRYPEAVSAAKFPCSVDGAVQTLAISAGAYAWDEMPDDTSFGVTETQCRAIGKLTYDCAVAQRTMFYSSSSPANGSFAFLPLKSVFGYANAIGYLKDGMSPEEIRKTVLASLDAGSPVILSLLTADDLGHEVVIDGYGYQDGVEYVHLNVGYNNIDGDNAWYRLSDIECKGSRYSRIDGIVYNIFPQDTGDVLSGRVTDRDGAPCPDVEVTAKSGSGVVGTARTNKHGIYAFVLPGGKTYTVSAGADSRSVSLPKSVSAKADWSQFIPSYSNAGTLGNSWGNDLVYDADVPVPPPVPPEDELGAFSPAKAISGAYPFCGVVRDAQGDVFGTISLKVGKAGKPKAGKPGVSKVSGTIQALDGKKYTIAGASVPVDAEKSAMAEGIAVKKLGTMDLRIGEKGFVAEIAAQDGAILSAETAVLSGGLAASPALFSVAGLPEQIDGHQVFQECLPDGEPIEVSSKGKWTLRKAATIKYKKISVKDPETKKKISYYELQGLDDPKKPNLSGLKLTYTAKTGTFKGSFSLYCNSGTEAKPKLKKLAFSVTGLVIDGQGIGLATCKKPAYSVPVKIQ